MRVRTWSVLTPDSDSLEVSSAQYAILEQVVQRTPNLPSPPVRVGIRIPYVVVRELQRVCRDDGTVTKT